jgi:dipeptidase D
LIKPAHKSKLEKYIRVTGDTIYKELQPVEKDFFVKIQKIKAPARFIVPEIIQPLLGSLYACPNGIIAMSQSIPGLVETSTNLASVKTEKQNCIDIVTSQRSSVESSKADIAQRIRTQFELIGAKVVHTGSYPGWTPNKNSEILKITESQHYILFKEKPAVKAIHAGLECGLFLDKYPHLDMISFGPTIRDAHSPDERMEIKTVERFWRLLLAVLENIPNR